MKMWTLKCTTRLGASCRPLSVWQEHICAQFTLASNDIIDVCFDYVTIVLGTDAHKMNIVQFER